MPGPTTRTAPLRPSLVAAGALALLTLACGGRGDAGAGDVVVRDSVGDTLVVRTVQGGWDGMGRLVPEVSVGVLDGPPEQIFGRVAAVAVGGDGTLYVLDAQVPTVRVFGADGSYVRSLGRSGGGPGEFGQLDGGLALLSDGRLAVRDPGNARLQIFEADGTPGPTWPVISGGFSTGSPLHRTAGDTLLTPVLMDRDVDISEWRMGLQRVSPSGEIVDTLEYPDAGYEDPFIEARNESEGGVSVSRNNVPFSPSESSTLHPEGWFVHGISDRYAFTLLRPGAWLRIEREVEAAPVASGEKAEAEAQAARGMRMTDPSWRWNGPAIPDRKPFYQRIYPAEDGRLWVLVELPGVQGEDPDYDPTDPNAVEDRWQSRYAFDVFRPDGTFVGRVEVPAEVRMFPWPVIRGDTVWAVTSDEFDVQRVVRYRLEPPPVG